MLNKIKEQILHILRKLCGYYGLEKVATNHYNLCSDYSKDLKIRTKKINELNDKNLELQTEIIGAQIALEKLSAQHEAKILEYDILDNKYKEVVNLTTNYTLTGDIYDLGNFSSAWSSENRHKYNSYLIAELEEILNIMKEKGIHPQDLIKRIITKAKRDIA